MIRYNPFAQALSFTVFIVFMESTAIYNYPTQLPLQAEHKRLIQQYSTIQHPTVFCPSSNQVTHLCANPNCEANSLACGSTTCTNCITHSQCQKSKLEDVTILLKNRSGQLKTFLQGFFYRQDKIYEAAFQRRTAYIQQTFSSGLDVRHTDVIGELYFKKQAHEEKLQIPGGYADDLQARLKGADKFRQEVLKKEPLKNYEQELGKINFEMEALQRALFDGLAEKKEVKTLQISKYGYYDITSNLSNIPPDEKRSISHLVITNTVSQQKFSVYCVTNKPVRSLQSKLYLVNYQARNLFGNQGTSVVKQLYLSDQGKGNIKIMQLYFAYHLDRMFFAQKGYLRSEIVKVHIAKIQGKCWKDIGQMVLKRLAEEPFIKEIAQFSGISCLTLKVWHEFNSWPCFQELAEVINRKMLHLQQLQLYVNHESSKENRILWAQKLKKGIKVRIKEFGQNGKESRIVATV